MRRNSDRVLRTKAAIALPISTPVGPAPTQHERQELPVAARIFLGLGQLEGPEDPVSNRDRIREALQPRCESREFVVSEIAVPDSGRQDQMIVCDRHSLAIRGISKRMLTRRPTDVLSAPLLRSAALWRRGWQSRAHG